MELRKCRPFLEREFDALRQLKLVVVLGKVAMDTYLGLLRDQGKIARLSDFRFGHDLLYDQLRPALLCSYHPSQQNTFTGKLTQTMLDELFARARDFIRSEPGPAEPPRS